MRRNFFLLISVALLLVLTLPTILSGRFTFAFDMGRDLLWVRNMVELRKPALIGPWGSIAGVFFGPLWFYLLAIPYLLLNGDPRGAVLTSLFGNLATLVLGWWWLGKHGHHAAAAFWALLYAVSPLVVSISSFAFHANLLPLTTLLSLIGIINFSATKPIRESWFSGLPLAALAISLSYQLEPAAGVMLTVFLGVWVLAQKLFFASQPIHLKEVIVSTILFLLPFVPQMIFEVRHELIQTQALLSYFRGENTSLGGVLPLGIRASERVTKISGTLAQSLLPVESSIAKWILLGIFISLSGWLMRVKKDDVFTAPILRFSLGFLLFHYLMYVFLFPAELKGWYLYGFVTIYLVCTALGLEWFFRRHRHAAGVVLIILVMLTGSVRRVTSLRRPSVAKAETVAAQSEVVLWVYEDALKGNEPFSVYTYTPPIYDYNYQYILWWQGTRVFYVLPAEYSYLPGESSYVPLKDRFNSNQWSPQEAKTYYLILEPESLQDRLDGWKGHFSQTELVSTKQFPSGVTVEKRMLL